MKLNRKRIAALAALAAAVSVSMTAGAGHAAGPTYTVCIDIPFHPIFDYVMAKKDTYFAGKPYSVQFKVLDATTQLPAFGAGQCNVITTPPSFIPRVTDRYHFQVAEFYPLARWVIGPQILVKKSSPYKTLTDLQGKKVATTRGSTAAAYLRELRAQVLEMSVIEDAYQALVNKEADAVVFDAPILLYYAANEGKGRVHLVGTTFRKEDYGIVFQAGNPLRKQVNNTLLAMREDGSYQQIYDKWFAAK